MVPRVVVLLLLASLAVVSCAIDTWNNDAVADANVFFNLIPSSAKAHTDHHLFVDPTGGFDHIQGMGFYYQYQIFTHNAVSPGRGFIAVYNTDNKYIKNYYIDDAGYHHPSSFQIIGDFLVLGLEVSDEAVDIFGVVSDSKIKIYNLAGLRGSSLSEHNHIALPVVYSLWRPEGNTGNGLQKGGQGGASATGITYLPNQQRYVLACYSTGYKMLDVYVSNVGYLLGQTGFALSFLYRTVVGSSYEYQNLNLFTETKGTVDVPYLLGFGYRNGNEDWLDLGKLDIVNKPTATSVTSRHVYLQSNEPDTYPYFIPHFRWGAGATWTSNDYLLSVKVQATARASYLFDGTAYAALANAIGYAPNYPTFWMYNGKFIRSNILGSIYAVFGNQAHGIVNPTVATRLFGTKWTTPILVEQILFDTDRIPAGKVIDANAQLGYGSVPGTGYFLVYGDNTKQHLAPCPFNDMFIATNQKMYAQSVLDAMPYVNPPVANCPTSM